MKTVRYIASYWTDGQPSRGMRGENKGRHTAIAYSVNKTMMVSLPARLNNYKMPTIRDMAALMRGDSVALAMAEFNAAQVAARRANFRKPGVVTAAINAAQVAAPTKYILVALDHMTPYKSFRDANRRANELAASGAPFGIWSCLINEWAQAPNDSRILAPVVAAPRVNLVKAPTMDEQTAAAIATLERLLAERLVEQVAARPAFYALAKPLHPTVSQEFRVMYAHAPDGKPAYYWWDRGNDTGPNCADLAACEKSALAWLRSQVIAAPLESNAVIMARTLASVRSRRLVAEEVAG